MSDSSIRNVQDTARWVAAHRALESERPDALFQDPFARRLAGERGFAIVRKAPSSAEVAWSVALRTVIIDEFIRDALKQGIDTVVNLGAGLDTRPYRMQLPTSLTWIEVDHVEMIEGKDALLRDETPNCRLERIKLDLAEIEPRRKLFDWVCQRTQRALVLTEGVVPYLDASEAAELADDLHARSCFVQWIIDYFSPEVYRWFARRNRFRHLRNAPLKFRTDDWHGFFATHGWKVRELVYLADTARKVRRYVAWPWWVRLMRSFMSKERKAVLSRMVGFAVLEPIQT